MNVQDQTIVTVVFLRGQDKKIKKDFVEANEVSTRYCSRWAPLETEADSLQR